jgi:hypothetical protein
MFMKLLGLCLLCAASLFGELYPRRLENWFLTASALPQNFYPHSRLASRQWSLAPDKSSEEPPCQIPNFRDALGMHVVIDPDVAEANPHLVQKLEWLGVSVVLQNPDDGHDDAVLLYDTEDLIHFIEWIELQRIEERRSQFTCRPPGH